MRRIAITLLILVGFISCKSKKNVVTKKNTAKTTKTITTNNSKLATKIINNAKQFEGVKYKYGGTTSKGMDCSGLIYIAFKKENISIPRISRDMAIQGNWVDIKKVEKGDLLFFATKKNSRKINHVGLVVSSRVGRIEFIHSTTSKGVITSSLAERYWYYAFVQARRVL